MKELSETLDFQVIVITHDDEVIEIADRVFKIENIKGESKVRVIK
jgi:DNA repair exonuclease SbcCD ATPase subunit